MFAFVTDLKEVSFMNIFYEKIVAVNLEQHNA